MLTFENDVKMYGTETNIWRWRGQYKFENDVKMYGTETKCYYNTCKERLRMM